MTSEELQRITRLEVELEHLKEKMEDTHEKVVEMHDLLTRARGAKWFIVGMAALAGYLASYAPKLSAIVGGLPK